MALIQKKNTVAIVTAVENIIDPTNAVIAAQSQLPDVISRLAITEKFDLNIYCSKTGQIFDEHNIDAIAKMYDVVGEQETKEYIARHNKNAVAPHWINTSPKNLNRLELVDPQGYASYAFSKAVQGQFIRSRKNATPEELKTEWQKCLRLINSNLSNHSVTTLARLNHALRRLLSVSDGFTQEINITMCVLMPQIIIEAVNEQLQQMYQLAIKNGWIHCYEIDYPALLKMREKFGGNSNIRGQRTPHYGDAMQTVINELAAFMDKPGQTHHKHISANKVEEQKQSKIVLTDNPHQKHYSRPSLMGLMRFAKKES